VHFASKATLNKIIDDLLVTKQEADITVKPAPNQMGLIDVVKNQTK